MCDGEMVSDRIQDATNRTLSSSNGKQRVTMRYFNSIINRISGLISRIDRHVVLLMLAVVFIILLFAVENVVKGTLVSP
jgi:hypothetical protein